jgi:hypothetical protein
VQEPLKRTDDRDLITGIVRIGNEKTPRGSKFLLLLVRPENQQAREQLRTGESFMDLAGFQRSTPIALVAQGQANAPAAATPVALTSN